MATAAALGKGNVFPAKFGHEVASAIAEVGTGVTRWLVGERGVV